MTITEFLLARIDEDQAAAHAAGLAPWSAIGPYVSLGAPRPTGTPAIDALGQADATHIARHDPARVLAECEAKRRIVEDHNLIHECISGPNLVCDPELRDGSYGGPCGTLMALATIYADHSDYREDWRP